ncbi:hypothetical protein HPB51_020437 [Rhipicephalus microplus]|uniref:Tick transposon n=1 Tax=Rhipicephalus microplus TaxID=6941 RepID=A0A9J6DC30_RHIMP|nr:hypothetical protein HPB51_020437 [Rhipicephalus microplus]
MTAENPLLTLPMHHSLLEVQVDPVPVTALIDTGASPTMRSEGSFEKHDAEKVEAIIRKVIRRARGLPVATSNAMLITLEVVNTFQELKEAHTTNQAPGTTQAEEVAFALADSDH